MKLYVKRLGRRAVFLAARWLVRVFGFDRLRPLGRFFGDLQQRFLGKDMPMPGGIVQLARQTRAPIVPIRSLAVDPVWHFQIEPRLQLLPGASFEEDMATVLGHVERQILARPELWSWPHRRWRKYPIALT